MIALRTWLRSLTAFSARRRTALSKSALNLEQLESRLVMYSASGNAWPAPQLITISFVPDGTIVASNGQNYIDSNLFATFNAKFGSPAAWQNIILKAAQSWAQQTNINFTVVADDGVMSGTGNYQQGDPGQGDIRFGGFNFNNSNLGMAEMPPPINNYAGAGDIDFNTAQSFNNGYTYDLFSVAAHEIGHALGLYESTVTAAEMYGVYNGAKPSLNSDDIGGIRSIYSAGAARGPAGGNSSVSTATDVTSQIDPNSLTALVTGLDLTTTTDKNYYTFTAPAGTSSTLTVDVQSQGLSLLSPKMTVYAADGVTVLGSAGVAGQYGTTLQVTVSGVVANEQFYVKVAGADTTPFATGDYAMTLNFSTGASPTVPLPATTLLNGTPFSAGGGYPQASTGNDSDNDTVSTVDEHNVPILSSQRSLPETVSAASGTAAFSPAAVSVLSDVGQAQPAPIPASVARGAFDTLGSEALSPVSGNFNRLVSPSGPTQLAGAGESQLLPPSADQGNQVVPVGVELDQQPTRPAEPQTPSEITPPLPQEPESPQSGASEPAISSEFQAVDACFMAIGSPSLNRDDAAGDNGGEQTSSFTLFGAAVGLVALQAGVRAEDQEETRTSQNGRDTVRSRF